MTQDCARNESRIRIAFDQSLELQSFASSIRSATADAIGEETAGENEAEEEDGSTAVVRQIAAYECFACVLGDECERRG